ncbi:hypothetical protein WJX77_011046 [Trebouxia sp. C0004]
MQPCSSLKVGLYSYLWLVALLSHHQQLAEARQLQDVLHLQLSAQLGTKVNRNRPLGAKNTLTDAARLKESFNLEPVCSNAYPIIHQSVMPQPSTDLSGSGPSWGSYLPVSIGGVTDPADQHVVIAISKIKQNEPTYNQHSKDSCPDAQVNGLNSLFVRYESSEAGPKDDATSVPRGRTYFINFTARNEAGLSCDGMVYVCVPSSGYSSCVTTDSDILHDSSTCAPHGQMSSLSID